MEKKIKVTAIAENGTVVVMPWMDVKRGEAFAAAKTQRGWVCVKQYRD